MEKDRNTRIIAVLALFVALIGVSVGFASWTATLTITDAEASVTKGENDNVFKSLLTIKRVDCSADTDTGSVIEVGTIENGSIWKGAKVQLTKPGDGVTCTATVENASDYRAYLTDIRIASNISCSGVGQNVQNACEALKMTVTGSGTKNSIATVTKSTLTNATGITENYIAAKTDETPGTGTISFKVEYEGNAVSDSDFTANLPTMNFDFSTVDTK